MHQLLIAGVPSTGLLTGPAELGARTACDDVIRRTTQHEVGARLAQLGTIKQHADEVDLGVVATARDAMLKRQRADSVAVKAVSYTHLRAHETGRNLVCRLLLEKKKT